MRPGKCGVVTKGKIWKKVCVCYEISLLCWQLSIRYRTVKKKTYLDKDLGQSNQI